MRSPHCIPPDSYKVLPNEHELIQRRHRAMSQVLVIAPHMQTTLFRFIEPRGRPRASKCWKMRGCCHLGFPSTISLAHSCLAPSRASTGLREMRSEPSGVVIHEVEKPTENFETGLISLAHLDMSKLLRAAFLWEMQPTLIVRRLKWAAFFARMRSDVKRPSWGRSYCHAM